MTKDKIAVFCDSGCDVDAQFVQDHNIFVFPLSINYLDGTYKSGVDITTDEVINRFKTEIPTTSLPSPILIEQTLLKAKEQGYNKGLYVGISSGLSGTLQTVSLMANSIEDFDVSVVDTKSIGGAAGLTVKAACEMVEEGIEFDLLQQKLEDLASKTSVYFVCKSLEYLHKGGRIGDATYKLGTTLNIMPVITCSSSGSYVTTKKARGINKALKYEVSMTNSRMEKYEHLRIVICDTKESECFEELKEMLLKRLPQQDIVFTRSSISAALVVHTGPEIVGVAAQPDWHTI